MAGGMLLTFCLLLILSLTDRQVFSIANFEPIVPSSYSRFALLQSDTQLPHHKRVARADDSGSSFHMRKSIPGIGYIDISSNREKGLGFSFGRNAESDNEDSDRPQILKTVRQLGSTVLAILRVYTKGFGYNTERSNSNNNDNDGQGDEGWR